MARIPEYTAPPVRLNPDDRAISAYNNYGRRIAGLYDDLASTAGRAGTLAAQQLTQKGKFDALLFELRKPKALSRGPSGGGGSFSLGGGGGGKRDRAPRREAGAGGEGLTRVLKEAAEKRDEAQSYEMDSSRGVNIYRGGSGEQMNWAPEVWPIDRPSRVLFGGDYSQATLEGLQYDDPLGRPGNPPGPERTIGGVTYGGGMPSMGDFSSRPEGTGWVSDIVQNVGDWVQGVIGGSYTSYGSEGYVDEGDY
jgi:hypothetical protein